MNFFVYRSYLKFKKKHKQKCPAKLYAILLFLIAYIALLILYQINSNIWFLIFAVISLIIFLILTKSENNKISKKSKEKFNAKKKLEKNYFII